MTFALSFLGSFFVKNVPKIVPGVHNASACDGRPMPELVRAPLGRRPGPGQHVGDDEQVEDGPRVLCAETAEDDERDVDEHDQEAGDPAAGPNGRERARRGMQRDP